MGLPLSPGPSPARGEGSKAPERIRLIPSPLLREGSGGGFGAPLPWRERGWGEGA